MFKDEDTEVVIVCDHGMGRTNAVFFINSFLYDCELIKLKGNNDELFNAYGKDINMNFMDLPNSIAWTEGLGGIVVNDPDKIEYISEFLKDYIDPMVNKPVFADVLKREDVWSGKYLSIRSVISTIMS